MSGRGSAKKVVKAASGSKIGKSRPERSNAGTWSILPMQIQQQQEQEMAHIDRRKADRRAKWEKYKQQLKAVNINIDKCEPAEFIVLIDILDELKVEENKMQLGGGKMVGGNNPIAHLFALNSWIATHQDWSTCVKWFLTQIWEKCCELYGYLNDGIGYAIGIIKDVGLTALGDTKTETFKFTVAAFYDLIDAGYKGIDAVADKTYPYFNAIEENVQKILVENKNKVEKMFPDVVTPEQFQDWLNNTSLVKKIYWTLVTLQSYQAGPLLAATVTTTSSIIMSASYYGALIAYYITSSKYFTFVLLTSAAGTSVYNRLSDDNQKQLKDLFENFDKFMADKVLGPEVSPLTSMMDEIKKLPDEAKLFALKKAKLQNELTKTILTNAEANAELGKILQTKEVEAKIADVEKATKQIREQIERFLPKEEEDKKTAADLGVPNTTMDTTPDGGKRRTRKRGKRHSKRAPRKTKTLRKKRRGKK